MDSEHKNDSLEIRRERFVPSTIDELNKFCVTIANSGMTPKGHCDGSGKPNIASMMVAIMFGDQLGVPPMQALQGICSIHEQPAIFGDLGLALVKAHPQFEDIVEERQEDGWQCTIKRRGQSDVTRKFTIEDAQKANLWEAKGLSENKRPYSPWVKYPWRMLQWRSRWWAMRDQFPDALKGIHAAEEYIDVESESKPVQVESPADQLRRLNAETRKSAETKDALPKDEPTEQKECNIMLELECRVDMLRNVGYKFSEKETARLGEISTDDEILKAIEYFQTRIDEYENETGEKIAVAG